MAIRVRVLRYEGWTTDMGAVYTVEACPEMVGDKFPLFSLRKLERLIEDNAEELIDEG